MASSHRSKESERTHSRTSFPYVHDKLCSKLRRKRRLRIQDRSAGCVLSCTDSSKQQEIPQVRLRKQGVPVSSTTFRSKYSPSSFYLFGVTAYGDSIPAPSGGFGDTISRRLASSPPGPSNFITTSGSANRYARPGRLHSESKEILAGPYSGSPVPRNSLTSGPRESFTPRVQGWGDSRLRAPSILPQGTKLFSSVPPYGFTQLGLRSYPSGSLVPGTPSTSFSFVRSDKPVYATAPIRPCGPCQPTAAVAGPTFSYLRNPDPPLSGGLHNFHGRLQSGLGRSHGGFQDFGYLDPYRPQAPHQLSGAQGGYLRPTAFGSSASGPPGHCRHGQFNSGFINKQGGTRSTSLLRLTVELFLWLESQDTRQGRSMYMFPPFPLLSKVVQKIRSTQVAEVILVAPWWPSQPWFPHLLCLCVEHPLFLPYCQDLLSQQDQKYISDGKSFHLHIWRLSCDTTKQQAFQTRSLGSRQLLGDPRPIACTTTDGVVSHDGLQDKVLIHLTPQPLR